MVAVFVLLWSQLAKAQTQYGLGLEIAKRENNVVVASVAKGSWAYYAGIKPGDFLLSVNDNPVDPSGLQSVVEALKAKANQATKLSVKRGDLGSPTTIVINHESVGGSDLAELTKRSQDRIRPALWAEGTLSIRTRAVFGRGYEPRFETVDEEGMARWIESGQLYPLSIQKEKAQLNLVLERSEEQVAPDPLAGIYHFKLVTPKKSIAEADILLTRETLGQFRHFGIRTLKTEPEGAILTYGGNYNLDDTPHPAKYKFNGPKNSILWISNPNSAMQTEIGKLPLTLELLKGDVLTYSIQMEKGDVLQGVIQVTNDIAGNFKPEDLDFPGNAVRDILNGKTYTPFQVTQSDTVMLSLIYDRAAKDTDSMAGIYAYPVEDLDGLVGRWGIPPTINMPDNLSTFLIQKVNGKVVHSLGQARTAIGDRKIGESIVLTISPLDKKEQTTNITIPLLSRQLIAPRWSDTRGRGLF